MQIVHPTDAKLFTPDCTGTLLFLAIPLHSIRSPPHWSPSAHQLVRQLLSSASSSSSSPLAIVLGGVGGWVLRGGLDGKLSRLGFETKCCGGIPPPRRIVIRLIEQRTPETHTGELNSPNKELQNARHHNHIYNKTFSNAHIKTSKCNLSEYKPRNTAIVNINNAMA